MWSPRHVSSSLARPGAVSVKLPPSRHRRGMSAAQGRRPFGPARRVVEAAIEASVLDSGHKREDRITYWRRAAAPPLPLHHIRRRTLEKETPHVSHSNSRWLAVIMLVWSSPSAPAEVRAAHRRRPPPPPHRPPYPRRRHPRIGHRHPRIGHRHGALEPRVDPGSRQLPHCRGRSAPPLGSRSPSQSAWQVGVELSFRPVRRASPCDYSGTGLNVIIELISNIRSDVHLAVQQQVPGGLRERVRGWRPARFLLTVAQRREGQRGRGKQRRAQLSWRSPLPRRRRRLLRSRPWQTSSCSPEEWGWIARGFSHRRRPWGRRPSFDGAKPASPLSATNDGPV